jgi:hypothetical protein
LTGCLQAALGAGAVVVTDEGLSVLSPQCWTTEDKSASYQATVTSGRHDRYDGNTLQGAETSLCKNKYKNKK